jgi:hypothetical protein
MTRRGDITAMVAGVGGAVVCGALIVRFLRAYQNNDLGWKRGISPPEFYDALGRHYGEGFLAGFFLCLFLMLAGAGLQSYRAARQGKPQQP